MNKIPLLLQEPIFNCFNFVEEPHKERLNFVSGTEVANSITGDEDAIGEYLGTLLTWEIVAKATTRFKPVVKKEDVYKTTGDHQVIFVHPECIESIPEHFRKFVCTSGNMIKGEALRFVNKGDKVNFRYNRLIMSPFDDSETQHRLSIRFDFNINKFHLEYMSI